MQTERVLQENERQLEKQNRELTRMNQLKSDMIAVTSHDLKSPLSAIIGYASLLEQYFLTLTEEKKIYYIKRIEEEGQKQLVFINQLLISIALNPDPYNWNMNLSAWIFLLLIV